MSHRRSAVKGSLSFSHPAVRAWLFQIIAIVAVVLIAVYLIHNTITNLNTQAENLQAAESRISDVDVATEMTSFVRNQILTQSAVAMLSQANSLPQMAMKLIGG